MLKNLTGKTVRECHTEGMRQLLCQRHRFPGYTLRLVGVTEHPQSQRAISKAGNTWVLAEANGKFIANIPVVQFESLFKLDSRFNQITVAERRITKAIMTEHRSSYVICALPKLQELPPYVAGDSAVTPANIIPPHAEQGGDDLWRVPQFLA